MADDGTTFQQREAVRMPMWLSIVGSAALYFAVSLLTGGWDEWRPSLVAILAGAGPLLFGTEVARGGAWSPLSVLQAAREARAQERTAATAPLVPVPEFTPAPADPRVT